MKRLLPYLVFSVLLLACGRQQEPVVEQPLPFTFDENLLRIDSLMQHDADSALQTLLSFRADSVISTEAQRSGEISCHYHSLLLSEAIYKTYNPQLNRFVGVETCHGASLQDNTIDISGLNAGMYIMKIRMAEGKEYTERIIKE